MVPRWTITPLVINGATMAMANVWTAKGHSSKTFASAAEATAWAKLKAAT